MGSNRQVSIEELLVPIDHSDEPFVFPWVHTATTPSGMRYFSSFTEWREYINGLDLLNGVWEPTRAKFGRARRLYLLAWLDYELIKAGELVALTALELSLKERYAFQILDVRQKNRKKRQLISLRDVLKHMVEVDGLTNDQIPIAGEYRTDIVGRLYETDIGRNERRKTSISEPITIDGIRNKAAHGDPFDALPWGALLEVVRDLIHFADRDRIARQKIFQPAKIV